MVRLVRFRQSLRHLLLLPGFVAFGSACIGPLYGQEAASASREAVSASSGGGVVLVGAGDIGSCHGRGPERTAVLVDSIEGTVFTTGDNAYPDGTAENLANCYDPAWGRHKARTRPTPGNHDYHTPGAAAYYDYFGANAGDPSKGYYSYDLGDWHVIALNSEIDMSVGSPQERWLRADLAANKRVCTIAYWHRPRFSSAETHGSSQRPKPLWDALYEHHAEIVVNGHDHIYERFAPQTPDGVLDQARGIRQFTVGTGGAGLRRFSVLLPNSEAHNDEAHGVLKLTLFPASYEWDFVAVQGATYTDSGSGVCHDAERLPNQAPVARTGGPYVSEGTVIFDASASRDPEANTPLSYHWDFGDGSGGSGVAPTHTYGADGIYTVTLVVTDALGAASSPESTKITIANQPPAVDVGTDLTANPGTEITVTASFADPGTDDGPWSHKVDWGDGASDSGSTAGGPISAGHTYADPGVYSLVVTVADKDGAAGSDTLRVSVLPAEPVLVAAGNIARCSNDNDEATAQLLDRIPGTVVTLGDNVYESGTAGEFRDCYGPSWGRHKARTRPVPGNHEYRVEGAAGYFGYFGAAAGDPDKGYYSYEIGAWHIIALNSLISMRAGSAQERWLRADLAASTHMCTLAYFHDARFYSAGAEGVGSAVKPLWDALYEAGAEIVLSSERRFYERFAPQTPDGDADPVWGIRQFIVGTGGWSSGSFGTIQPNSEVREGRTFGVLKLTLHDTSYEWEYVPIAGQTFSDSGSGTCHGPPGKKVR